MNCSRERRLGTTNPLREGRPYRPDQYRGHDQNREADNGKIEHFDNRPDLLFIGQGSHEVAALISVARGDDHPPGLRVGTIGQSRVAGPSFNLFSSAVVAFVGAPNVGNWHLLR